jgi:hypothetical protein
MSRIEYMSLCAVALLGLASCASTQSAAPGHTDATPATSNLSAEQLAQAKRAGYRVVVTKSGNTLFCQKATKTGSHMATDECHSAQEWDDINAHSGDASNSAIRDATTQRTQPGN